MTALLVAGSVSLSAAQWMIFGWSKDPLFSQGVLGSVFGLHADSPFHGSPWQFLTFALLHGGPLHLLGNVLLLYFAGREVEPIIGAKHFAALFLGALAFGAAAQWGAMAGALTPVGAGVLGISAGVAAVVAAFATILPELDVTVLLLLVVPLRVRAKFLGLILALLAAGLWMTQTAVVVGPAGIIAGSLFGWAYAKRLGFGNPTRIERYYLARRQEALRLERMPAAQFIEEQVNPVLEKIARHGLHSLTQAEKRLLHRGSGKLVGKADGRRARFDA